MCEIHNHWTPPPTPLLKRSRTSSKPNLMIWLSEQLCCYVPGICYGSLYKIVFEKPGLGRSGRIRVYILVTAESLIKGFVIVGFVRYIKIETDHPQFSASPALPGHVLGYQIS